MKRIFYFTVLSTFMLGLTGCDKDDVEVSFESLIETSTKSWSKKASYENGIILEYGENVDMLKFHHLRSSKEVTFEDDKKLVHEVYLGKSQDNMELQSDAVVNLDKPFEKYYYRIVSRIEYNGKTYYDENSTEGYFYYIPKNSEIILTSDNGEDDIAAKINWKCVYYGYDDRGKIDKSKAFDIPLDGFVGSLSISTDYDTTYNEKPLEVSLDSDEIYVKAGKDYPSSKAVYYPGTETIRYLDAIKYNFTLKLEKDLDGEIVNIENSCTDIFMDKSNCVQDMDHNMYRYTKIGNQYWTIDDFRLKEHAPYGGYKLTLYLSHVSNGIECCYYMLGNIEQAKEERGFDIIPQGFHIPSDDEWNELEDFYGDNSHPEIENYFEFSYEPNEFINSLSDSSQDMKEMFCGSDTGVAFYLGSSWGWDNYGDKKVERAGQLGLLPSGFYLEPKEEFFGFGVISVYGSSSKGIPSYNHCVRVLANGYNGILHAMMDTGMLVSLRLVKDEN